MEVYRSTRQGEGQLNAQCNMNAAHDIYVGWGNSFGAWTTYQDGAYKQNISAVEKAVNQSANLPPDVTGPQPPNYTVTSLDSSSSDGAGLGFLGISIGAILAGASIIYRPMALAKSVGMQEARINRIRQQRWYYSPEGYK